MNYRNKVHELFPSVVRKLTSEKGKLAYISLTSKPENTIRNEFAWLLQQKLDKINQNLISAREYSRYDLAVLKISDDQECKKPDAIEHIFEFKVSMAGDFRDDLKAADSFIEDVIKDFEGGHEDDNELVELSEMTSVFIACEALKKIEHNQRPFIKYAARHNGLRKHNGNTENYIKNKLIGKFKEAEKLDFIKYACEDTNSFKGHKVRLHLITLKANIEYFD